MNNKENFLLPIVAVIVLGAVAITGIVFGGKDIEKIVEMTEQRLGGLVHNVQEIYSQGLKAGTSETEVINSSGQWVYQVNGTTIAGTTGTLSSTLAVTGVSTLTDLIATGESNLDTLVQGGDVIWVHTTTTLTAAQVCNSSVINIGLADDPVMTLTLPTTATLVADCLTTAGDHDDTNADVLAAGASVELELYVATSTESLIGVLRPFTDVD
jgi:hypothetical protein